MGVTRVIIGSLVAGVAVVGSSVAVFGGVGAFDDETRRDEAGEITTSGGIGAFVVRVGDCIQQPDGDRVVSVEGVPCDTPHDAEAYATHELSTLETYDADAVERAGAQGCVERWRDAIGTDFWSDADVDARPLLPSPESWAAGDRGVTCLVTSIDGSRLVGSRLRRQSASASGEASEGHD